MDEHKKYHLYAVMPQDIPKGEKHYIITPEWTLLYTQNNPPERSEEVKRVSQLPILARDWLAAAIEDVRREYLALHQVEVERKARDFQERFAKEIAAEREMLEKHKEGNANAQSNETR